MATCHRAAPATDSPLVKDDTPPSRVGRPAVEMAIEAAVEGEEDGWCDLADDGLLVLLSRLNLGPLKWPDADADPVRMMNSVRPPLSERAQR